MRETPLQVSRIRVRISPAADTVKVTTSRRRTSPPRRIFSIIRRVSTAVFPEPAAADTYREPPSVWMAACCAGVQSGPDAVLDAGADCVCGAAGRFITTRNTGRGVPSLFIVRLLYRSFQITVFI